MKRNVAHVLVCCAIVCIGLSSAAQQGPLTEKESDIVKTLDTTLHYALDTLSGKHTVSDAVSHLKQVSTTNTNLIEQLNTLSRSNNGGMRNLALWCIEVLAPDDNAVWKRIVRDGRVVSGDALKTFCAQLSFMLKMGLLSTDCSQDMHIFDEFTGGPVITVVDFVKLYGSPERKGTLQGSKDKSYKWLFYGPVGVKVDDSETNVLGGQMSMSTILWFAAFKAYGEELNSPSKEAIPDLNGVFLKVAADKSPKKPGADTPPANKPPEGTR